MQFKIASLVLALGVLVPAASAQNVVRYHATGTGVNIFLVLMGAWGMLWMSGLVRWPASTSSKEQS